MPSYKKFGTLLRQARVSVGIEKQSDLAKLLGARQQTVSRWEAGTSRPRAEQILRIAKLVSADADDLSRAAGYAVDAASPAGMSTTAAASFDQPFPIDALTPEAFERFCTYLIEKLFPAANVNRLGGTGHSQDGVDIEATFPDGKVHSFQCKRVSEFGPGKVHAAVAKHTRRAVKKVLVLSRIASPQARDAASTHRGWEIWDKDDIARRIRGLPKDEQRHLVDIFFRHQRFALLGETEPGPWLTTEEFFLPFSSDRTAFSHTWALVGKDEEVGEIGRQLADDSIGLQVVAGSGGAGKSRVLKQVIEGYETTHRDRLVRFLSPTDEITPKSFEDLGDGPKLLIVDDAHDRIDLPSLFQYAANPKSRAKLLLAVRPYGLDYVKLQAGRFALIDDSTQTVTLKPLELHHAKALATQVLEKFGGALDFVDDLARLTKDCPLATVVGAQVLTKGKAHPELVKNEELFRSTILGKFQDVIAGEIGDKNDAELIRKLLRVLALLQPFHPEDLSIIRAVNSVEGIADHEINRLIRRLTEAGILFKRGGKYRLSPDLLADHVIENACIGLNGSSTGYAERVFDTADAVHAPNLLLNLGKLDWRRADGNPSNSRLMDGLWRRLNPDQQYSDPHIRAAVDVAYFQPERALDFVERLLRENRSFRDIPNIVKYAAYNYDHLERACAILWELGKGDRRQLHQHPEHAIRILSEMCAVEPSKPIAYNEKVVDFALSLLPQGEPWQHEYSPLDILKGILRADGHTTETQGTAISISKFRVWHETVAALRRKAIDAIVGLLPDPDLHRALLAAHLLQEALRYPMDGTAEERKVWTVEFLRTMENIGDTLAAYDIDPLVRIAVSESVSWHARYGNEPTRPAATKLMESMPMSLEFRTTLALVDGHGYRLNRIDDAAKRAAWNESLNNLSKDLSATYPAPSDLFEFIEKRLTHVRVHSQGNISDSSALIGKLIAASLDFARQVAEAAIDNPTTEMRYFVGDALARLLMADRASGLAVAGRLLDTEESDLLVAVALAYLYLDPMAYSVGDDDAALLRAILTGSDDRSISTATRALRTVARVNLRLALDLALSIDLGKSANVADEVFSLFAADKTLSSEALTDTEIDQILRHLMELPELRGYWVETFLAMISKSHAVQVAAFLRKRVEMAVAAEDWSYRPCNFGPHVHVPLRIRESQDFDAVFRETANWIKSRPDNAMFKYRSVELFDALFSPFDGKIVATLEVWLDAATADDIAAIAHILAKASPDFVFAHRPFVVRFLDRAKQHGKKILDSAITSLYCAATSGLRMSTLGQPSTHDLRMKEQAEKALSDTPRISAAYTLYVAIKKDAEEQIKLAHQMAENLEE